MIALIQRKPAYGKGISPPIDYLTKLPFSVNFQLFIFFLCRHHRSPQDCTTILHCHLPPRCLQHVYTSTSQHLWLMTIRYRAWFAMCQRFHFSLQLCRTSQRSVSRQNKFWQSTKPLWRLRWCLLTACEVKFSLVAPEDRRADSQVRLSLTFFGNQAIPSSPQ